MRRLIVWFVLVSLAIVGADGVLFHYGRKFLDTETRRLIAERDARARRSAEAARDAVAAALEELLAVEDTRNWREYGQVFIPEDAFSNFAVTPSPIRTPEPESLVRSRLTFDATGSLGSPWKSPSLEVQKQFEDSGGLETLTQQALIRERLESNARNASTLYRSLQEEVPAVDRVQDAITSQVAQCYGNPDVPLGEILEAQSGNVLVQRKLNADWTTQKNVKRALNRYRSSLSKFGWERDDQAQEQQLAANEDAVRPAETSRLGLQARMRAETNEVRQDAGGEQQSLVELRRPNGNDVQVQIGDVDIVAYGIFAAEAPGASTVRVSPLAAVQSPDLEAPGGKACYFIRRVEVTPWPVAGTPAPAFQGFELDIDRGLTIARAALERHGRSTEDLQRVDESASSSRRAGTFVRLPAPLAEFGVAVEAGQYGSSAPLAATRALLYGAAGLIFVVATFGLFGLFSLLWRRTELAERRTDFVAAVSHELKAPLAGIRALAEMMDEGMVRTEEKRSEYVRHILHESERLSRIVANVLDLARLERQERRYDVATADPTEAIREAVRGFEGHLGREGVGYEVEVPDGLASVRIDRDALVQVLSNLIDNAAKYACQEKRVDGAQPRIRVCARTTEDGVTVEVTDNGPGVPVDERAAIFTPFYRGRAHLLGGAGGAGLGLAIARSHVSAMDGALTLRDAEGGGAVFSIALVLPRAT